MLSGANTIEISLKKYHYRYLGALERDLDSFNRSAGLPFEVVEAFRRLLCLAKQLHLQPLLFCQSSLLRELVEFFLKIPEGLIPISNAWLIASACSDRLISRRLRTLAAENYFALRCIACFVKAICFNKELTLIPFEMIDQATGFCAALSPVPRDDRLKPILINIFKDPSKYFICSKLKQQKQ